MGGFTFAISEPCGPTTSRQAVKHATSRVSKRRKKRTTFSNAESVRQFRPGFALWQLGPRIAFLKNATLGLKQMYLLRKRRAASTAPELKHHSISLVALRR